MGAVLQATWKDTARLVHHGLRECIYPASLPLSSARSRQLPTGIARLGAEAFREEGRGWGRCIPVALRASRCGASWHSCSPAGDCGLGSALPVGIPRPGLSGLDLLFGSGDCAVGWGLSRKGVVAGKFVPSLKSLLFIGFRREESGMSREFCRDVLDPWECSKSLCKKVRVHFSFPILGTDPLDLTLESASPSPAPGSIWHRFDIDSTLIRHRFLDLTQ